MNLSFSNWLEILSLSLSLSLKHWQLPAVAKSKISLSLSFVFKDVSCMQYASYPISYNSFFFSALFDSIRECVYFLYYTGNLRSNNAPTKSSEFSCFISCD
jgi:hypothetical protein